MQPNQDAEVDAVVGGGFTDSTVILNQSLCRLRMLVSKLGSNFALIDTVHQKVSLGGMARQSSALVSEVQLELETMQGLCWSAINSECEQDQQPSFEEWSKISSEPPAWLREVFESAVILSGMPDEPSLARISAGQQVLVLRAPELRGQGLIPQVAALMPKGFGQSSTQVWWPWVMGTQVPVVLEETDTPNVLQEVTAGVFLDSVVPQESSPGR